jgi:hypothetical protein
MINSDWLQPAKMQRVIWHWTAGRHTPSSVDLSHYHFLITGNGTMVKGKSVKLNEAPVKAGYAAHTRNCNSGSIGVSLCGMMNAQEVPFKPGPYPFTKVQWDTMVRMIADLCAFYAIKVKRETVLSHAEVQRTLGIKQRNKWDIARIPYDLDTWGARTVGDMFRSEVIMAMNLRDGVDNPETAPVIPPYEEDRPLWAYNLLRNMGWSHVASVALVGNAQQESYMDLRFHDPETGKPVAGDKHLPGGSIGNFQWNDGSKGQFKRRTNFLKYVKSIGRGWDDLEANFRFADHELRTTEKAAGDMLRAAQTIYSANRGAISYLRPQGWSALFPQGGHGWKNRLNNSIALDARLPK